MTRHQTTESNNKQQKQIKLNKPTKPNKYLKNKSNTFSFEDPHLDKFFQQDKQNDLMKPSKKVLILHEDAEVDDQLNVFHDQMDSEANTDDFYDEISSSTSEISSKSDSIDSQSSSSSLLSNIKLDLNIKFNENDTYRIGNWVYCEFEPNQPYSIRRIDELKKKSDDTIEAKFRCAFRRCDIPTSLLSALEKRYSQYFTSQTTTTNNTTPNTNNTDEDAYLPLTNNLNAQEIYQLKQRELFYSKYTEFKSPFDVNCLRGKVDLNLFMPDIHVCTDYLKFNQNKFFYQINYDENQKRLSLDRIQIRVGAKFQADLPDLITTNNTKISEYKEEYIRETLVWNGNKCLIRNNKLLNYIDNISNKYSNNDDPLKTRDNLKYEAIERLNEFNYNEKKASESFAKNRINEWTLNDSEKFQEGINKYGRDFNQIQKKILTNKTTQKIVEYYYNVWKRTNEHIKKRQLKRVKKQSDRLDFVYIPNSSLLTTCEVEQFEINSDSKTTHNEQHQTKFITCIACQSSKQYQNFTRKLLAENNYLKTIPKEQDENLTDQNELITSPHVQTNKIRLNQTCQQLNLVTQSNSNQLNSNENICNECWIYWKKYGGFKTNQFELNYNSSERIGVQQRLNKRATTAKSQTFKCLIDNCCREFKDRADFASHSTITHALIIKQIVQPRPSYLHLHNFYLKTTQLTKAARSLFDTLIQREARKPYIKRKNLFNLIKTEWYKEPRDIKSILALNKSKKISKKRDNIESIIDKLINNLPNTKIKNSGFIEVWRPLTPISCIVGGSEDEEKKKEMYSSKCLSSAFVSPCLSSSSSSNLEISSNKRTLRTESTCSSESKLKKIKTSNTSQKADSLVKNFKTQNYTTRRVTRSLNTTTPTTTTNNKIIDENEPKSVSPSSQILFQQQKFKDNEPKLVLKDIFYFSMNKKIRQQLINKKDQKIEAKKLARNPFREFRNQSKQTTHESKRGINKTEYDQFYLAISKRKLRFAIKKKKLRKLARNPFRKLTSRYYKKF